jgi:hypothetical protein
MPDIYSFILLPFVTIIGFFVPGYLLTRLFPSPSVALSSFLGSILLLFWAVLTNQLLGLPIDFLHVGGGVGVIILILFLIARRRPVIVKQSDILEGKSPLRADHVLYLAAAFLGLASIMARATIDPLSGYDNIFRWNALSIEMLTTKSLSYYPPMSADSFAHYGWCDGMAPLVSSLNFWLYMGTGSTAPVMTIARIAVESGLLFFGVFQFARVLWGSRAAGWTAMGMLATSSVALWALAMGQETGLTALTLVAMLYFLHGYSETRGISCAIWAGVAAASGALSREYGLAYIGIGAIVLSTLKPRWRDLFTFLAVAIVLSLPWYIRNVWITGNPFYSMDLLGLFPVNTVHKTLMAAISRNCIPASIPADLRYTFFLIIPVVFMGAVLLGAARGVYYLRLKSGPLLLAGLMMAGLWYWSIGQTAGGWVYSMRVLSPMIALAAILAGNFARLSARMGLLCGVTVLTLSVDSARRSWYLPSHALTSPWSLSFANWIEFKKVLLRLEAPGIWAVLVKEAHDKAIVVAHPVHNVLVMRQGGHAVPLFSPRADCMFDKNASFADVIRELRARNIRFITWIKGSPINDDFGGNYPFFEQLHQDKFKAITIDGMLSIYDVEMISELLHTNAVSDTNRR